MAGPYRVELVACEPLIVDPIAAVFAADGRLWVVEMRGFMPNVDGQGELVKNGVIAVLEDTDEDGRMDRRTVFLDGLVLPRAVLPIRDGALVLEPPRFWLCRDVDGDGKCDERTDLGQQFDGGLTNLDNPGASGLLVSKGSVFVAYCQVDLAMGWMGPAGGLLSRGINNVEVYGKRGPENSLPWLSP